MEVRRMGLTVVTYDEGPGPRRNKAKKNPPAREVDVMDYEYEDLLERFTGSDVCQRLMPMVSRWTPWGRDWNHSTAEIESIVPEFERALTAVDAGSETSKMLEQLLAMSRRAVAEHLCMAVIRD
ncbi:MAG: hypothetical protein PGN11_02600 [Quadrisphaera sp.]